MCFYLKFLFILFDLITNLIKWFFQVELKCFLGEIGFLIIFKIRHFVEQLLCNLILLNNEPN